MHSIVTQLKPNYYVTLKGIYLHLGHVHENDKNEKYETHAKY